MVDRPLDSMVVTFLLCLLTLTSIGLAIGGPIDQLPLYTINYLNNTDSLTSKETVRLASAENQYVECVFNDQIDTEKKSRLKHILKTLPTQYNLSEIPELQTEVESAFNILKQYNIDEAHLTRNKYWTYAMLNGKLYQTNGNLKIVLADMSKNLSKEDLILEKSTNQSVSLSHNLQNGAICDLTSRPRKTNIRFQYIDKLDYFGLVSVHEIQTCEYDVLISVPELKETIFQYGFLEPLRRIDCYSSDRSMINLADYQISVLSHKWFLGAKDRQLILITDIQDPSLISKEELNLILLNFPRHGPPELGITSEISPHDTFLFIIPVYSYSRIKVGDVHVEQNINGQKRFLFTENRIPHDTPNFRMYNGVNLNKDNYILQ